jgi:hypothetical protein
VVILHIGAPKTGTTAIQWFLQANRDRLDGVSFPRPFWGSQARRMWVYAQFPALASRDARLLGITPEQLPDLCEEYAITVRMALAASGTAVACNELLFSLDDHGIDRIGQLLEPHSIRVVMYIRRQDQLAVSTYLQAIKRDIPRSTVFPTTPGRSYREIIQAWSSLGKVEVRLYDRRLFPEGDVVRDFLRVLAVPVDAEFEWPAGVNPSWGRAQLLLGKVFNHHFPFLDEALLEVQQKERRQDLLRFLARLPRDDAAVATRAQAMAYMRRFEVDNEWVGRHYFPERTSLFSDDFSMYPEDIEAMSPSVEDALDALMELWRFRTEEVADLKKRVARLESAWITKRVRRLLPAPRRMMPKPESKVRGTSAALAPHDGTTPDPVLAVLTPRR